MVKHALEAVRGQDIGAVAETIKKTAFKITRVGQLVAQEAARRLDTQFGIIDLSLAPTPAIGDSVAHILEEIGLESCGCPGTTAVSYTHLDVYKRQAQNPCPCGYLGDKKRECSCKQFEIERYHRKLSGPLLDRIDLQLSLIHILR